MSCFDNIETEDLDHCLNVEPASGISEVGLYYGLHNQVTTFPTLPAPDTEGATYSSVVTVTTPFIFQAGKGFAKVKVQVETGELKTELVGNTGNKKDKQTLDFFVPKTDKQTLGYLRLHKNSPQVFIVTDKDGSKRQLGSKECPAYIVEANGTSGKGPEDERGVSFSVVTYAPVIFYEAAIPQYVPGGGEAPAGG